MGRAPLGPLEPPQLLLLRPSSSLHTPPSSTNPHASFNPQTQNVSSIAEATQQRKTHKAKLHQREKHTFIALDPHILANAGRFIDEGRLVLTLPVSYYLSERDYPAGIPGIALEKSI